MPDFGNIPDDCHARIRAAMDYWAAIHFAEGLPGRRNFDPRDIPALLPHLRLTDVLGPHLRFRIRLMGTRLVGAIGTDHTGKVYDEVFEDFERSPPHNELRDVVENHEPNWRRGDHRPNPAGDYISMERVVLPKARDGENVDMLLMLTHFEPRFDNGETAPDAALS